MKPIQISSQLPASAYSGVIPGLRAPLIEDLCVDGDWNRCVIFLPDWKLGDDIAAQIEFYHNSLSSANGSLEVLLLPPPDFEENDASEEEHLSERLLDRIATLTRLADASGISGERIAVITTIEAFFSPVESPDELRTAALTLKPGDIHDRSELIEYLAAKLGYDAEAVCEYPGQFSVRGGLLDVYPINAEAPVRLDFFGDELETLREFDPTTQRSTGVLPSVTITQRPRGSSSHSSIHQNNILSYFATPAQWIWVEPASIVENSPEYFRAFERLNVRKTSAADIIDRPGAGEDRHVSISELDTQDHFLISDRTRWIELNAEPIEHYRRSSSSYLTGLERLESEQSSRSDFIHQIQLWSKTHQIFMVVHNEAEGNRLQALIDETLETSEACRPTLLLGRLETGFRLSRDDSHRFHWSQSGYEGIVVVTESEILGRRLRLPSSRTRRKTPMRSRVDQMLDFSELAEGDYLVHLAHGICRFGGLSQMDLKTRREEVISLEFADNVILHLPLHESHLVTRYVGLAKVPPRLGKLGSGSWEKSRQTAEKATLDLAADLLRMQAVRDQESGHSFAPDSEWQRTFEAAFPYRETLDQAAAILAAKEDMERLRPMDRLICGDVGFGKTEVAIRAAFKAVMDNKQVAILAPTTVLAQQHFNTFRERMAEYPVSVEMVSRFRTPGQQSQILKQAKEGKIDILIGTHRLLSRDVEFKDLGLLVVDEEHRFGVRHKEQIKRIRTHVDVLTMSATPIPRTLYMALIGARDLSTIETPPSNRRPIETAVRGFDLEIVRKAIRFELERGGQVFYLHNRVQTIESVRTKLAALAPEAKIAVGHGQMTEESLEDVMTRFVAGETDILVCTTIIENGIDIPNCNTIIIESADRFGLSQLYQLRGRVGRFSRQAYAYLLLHQNAASGKTVARSRLAALKQHNRLGSGFKIAMRDLELRGAGNLLGAQQSGHIASIGFELYCQLLQQSVARLKGNPEARRIRASVNLDFVNFGPAIDSENAPERSVDSGFNALREAEISAQRIPPVEASIPSSYIGELRLRIDFYRKLATAVSLEEITQIHDDLIDRFGRPPRPTESLLAVSRIRVRAEQAGVLQVTTEGNQLRCLRSSGQRDDYIKLGSRFPRLTEEKPLPRLREIEQFLARNCR